MGSDPDRVVFPDQDEIPRIDDTAEEGATTMAVEEPMPAQLNGVGLAMIIVGVGAVILLVLLLYFRWRRRKVEKEKEEENQVEKISFGGTLGATYNHVQTFPETQSLLSSRKSSTITNHTVERMEDQTDGVLGDSRVSRFIDSSAMELNRNLDEPDRSFGGVLEEGREGGFLAASNISFGAQPPMAPSEDFSSRPDSTVSSFSVSEILSNTVTSGQSISIIGEKENNGSRPISKIVEDTVWEAPQVTLLPPSPMENKERPHSMVVDVPPAIPVKQRMLGASSDLQVHSITKVHQSPTSSRSDSHLAIVPPLPPKAKPFLPPKQAIGKSKEDLERINKELLRSSSMGSHSPITEEPRTDQDYDFPTNDDNYQEDYDEPLPVIPDQLPQALQNGDSFNHIQIPLPERKSDTHSAPPVNSDQEGMDYDEPAVSHWR